jgi:hypothetical protein
MFPLFVSMSFWDLDGAAWVIQLYPMAINFLLRRDVLVCLYGKPLVASLDGQK